MEHATNVQPIPLGLETPNAPPVAALDTRLQEAAAAFASQDIFSAHLLDAYHVQEHVPPAVLSAAVHLAVPFVAVQGPISLKAYLPLVRIALQEHTAQAAAPPPVHHAPAD